MTRPIGEEPRWLALFDSIHQVLSAERVLAGQGLWCDLVPLPKNLSSDCGMAVRFRREDAGAVSAALAGARLVPRGMYRSGSGGYERVTELRDV